MKKKVQIKIVSNQTMGCGAKINQTSKKVTINAKTDEVKISIANEADCC